MVQIQESKVMRAAALLMATTCVARVLGYARDSIMFNIFGQNRITDAYGAAFTIPDYLYTVLIGGALSAAFIPVFSSYLAKDDQDNAWQVSSIVISWGMLVMCAAASLAFIFTPQLVELLVPGFEDIGRDLTVTLTRIMLIQPVFMALSGIAMGILHAHQHFIWPAIGSLLYNAFIVVFGALLSGPVEARFPGYGVAGFSIGVVIGSIAYFLVQLPALRRVNFRFHFSLNAHHPGFVRLLHLMLPIILGLSVKQINLIVNRVLASSLEGAVAALGIAQKFMNVPIYTFAAAIVVAIFPTLTRQAAQKDLGEFKKSLSLGIRSVAFICIPSAVGLIVLREPIIRLLFEFQGGNFYASDTVFAGQALLFYCLGLTFYALNDVLMRGFYAMQNTITPVLVGIGAVAVNVVFSIILVKPMAHMGLALAYSIAGTGQCVALFYLLRKYIGPMDIRRISTSFIKTLAVGLIMGLTAFGVCSALAAVIDVTASKMAQLIQLASSMGLAVIIFFGLTYFMNMEEAHLVIDIFKRRLRRRRQQTTAGEDR